MLGRETVGEFFEAGGEGEGVLVADFDGDGFDFLIGGG